MIYPRCHFYSFYTKIDLSENFATEPIRLYFDAVYQERRYGRADIDKDTGEVLNNK
ncbi:protein of unknown function (plasmid) [Pseudolactococcus piscium]|nr:protein of unknown function [Lactococcus piscium]